MEKQDINQKVNMSDEKLTDRAFSRALITSVFGIVICLIMLCSATWAWFAQEASSSSNVICTGNFTANMGVYSLVSQGEPADADGEGASEGELIYANNNDDGVYEYSFDGNLPYNVRIAYSGKAYCKIYIDGVETKFVNLSATDGTFDFIMTLSDAATVRFEFRWGMYSGDSHVVDGGSLDVAIPNENKADADPDPESETEHETEPVTEPETEPETEPVTEPETELETEPEPEEIE